MNITNIIRRAKDALRLSAVSGCKRRIEKIINNIKSDIESNLYDWKSDSNCSAQWGGVDYWGESDCGCYLYHNLECGQHIKCFLPNIVKNIYVNKELKEIEKQIDDL